MPKINLKCACGVSVVDAATYSQVPASCDTCKKQVHVTATLPERLAAPWVAKSE